MSTRDGHEITVVRAYDRSTLEKGEPPEELPDLTLVFVDRHQAHAWKDELEKYDLGWEIATYRIDNTSDKARAQAWLEEQFG